jgi:esterase/lipase superfamily enzyme
MSFTKKRIWIALTIVGVILALVVAFFYRPTRLALERAESFQFRRMLVNRQGDQGAYRFFFITNRDQQSDTGGFDQRFGNQRQEKITLGIFDTEIEPSLGIGMIINPTDWFQNEEIQLRSVATLNQDAFVTQLKQQVEASPLRALLIKINGFREQFPSALRKTAFLSHVLDIDTPVLVFDWPGNQGNGIRAYRRAQRVAGESGAELAQALQFIIDEIGPDKIWLVANSMGAEVVVHGLSKMYLTEQLADAETEIEDVVLTAPDVDNRRFNDQFKKEMSAIVRNLTVYVSSNDRALLMSRLLNRGRRLGESSLDPRNPDQTDVAESVFELVEPEEQLVTLVDVTPINRTRNFHNFSLETPEFFDDLFLRLVNEEMPRSRPEYRVVNPDGRVYHILTRSQ